MRRPDCLVLAAVLFAPALASAQASATVPVPPSTKVHWSWSGGMPASGLTTTLKYFACEAEGAMASVAPILFYSNPYSGDSSVCSAAIHAGVIRRDQGGTFAARLVDIDEALPAAFKPGASVPGKPGAGGLTSSAYTYNPSQKLFWIFPARKPLEVEYRGSLPSVEIVVEGKVLGTASPGRPLTIQAPPEGSLEVVARKDGASDAVECVLGKKAPCVLSGPGGRGAGAAPANEGGGDEYPAE